MINYPYWYSEFDVHAELYSKLISLGYDVKGHIKATNKTGKICIFDLVIFDKNKQAQCIIEVKNNNRNRININTKQYQKYSEFNIPIFMCPNREYINTTIQSVLNLNIILIN